MPTSSPEAPPESQDSDLAAWGRLRVGQACVGGSARRFHLPASRTPLRGRFAAIPHPLICGMWFRGAYLRPAASCAGAVARKPPIKSFLLPGGWGGLSHTAAVPQLRLARKSPIKLFHCRGWGTIPRGLAAAQVASFSGQPPKR
jgi:hypothetical protein